MLDYQCVSIFNRDTLVLFFVNVEQMYYLDCLLTVILKKYESVNHFEKYKGIKNKDMCGNTKY